MNILNEYHIHLNSKVISEVKIIFAKDNCIVHKTFPKTFPKSVSYILLKCLYASHSPGGVPKTAIKFHILHFFLLQLTYTGFSTKYFTTK